MPERFTFDDRNIRWYKLGDLEHLEFAMLALDEERKIVDFIIKFEANEQIVLHRHLTETNTFVVQGEHRLYEPDGELREVRPVGSYTSSPAGDPHREGSGGKDCIVLYSTRGDRDGLVFEVLDDEMNVVGTLGMADFRAALEEQRAA